MTIDQHLRNLRTTLTVILLVACTALAALLSAQAKVEKAPKAHQVDRDATFHYAALQLDPASGMLVITRSSLEHSDQDRGLLIESELGDDRKVCLEVGGRGQHEHRCITLGQLRRWVRAGAPPAQ